MHNLITLTNYQTRLALYAEAQRNKAAGRPENTLSEAARSNIEKPAEELLRYLLFINEAPLEGQVKGTSGFAEEFAARGPRDPQGRSLRDFDLRTRIFKYPCSYLIYNEAFDALPSPAKEYVYRRLLEILTGREPKPEFARLTGEDRRAILEILLATKPGLPEEWKQVHQTGVRGESVTQKGESMRASRSLASLAAVIICLGASVAMAESLEGRWDASVTIRGTVIPFRLDLAGEGAKFTGTLFNGDIPVTPTGATVRQRHRHAELRALPYEDRGEGEGWAARRYSGRALRRPGPLHQQQSLPRQALRAPPRLRRTCRLSMATGRFRTTAPRARRPGGSS